MKIEILLNGEVDNTIEADEAFAEANYPGSWRIAAQQHTEPSPAVSIIQTIESLERSALLDQQRITRETVLALAEERAVAKGLTLEQLKLKNKGYAGLKALDEQIEALRYQL